MKTIHRIFFLLSLVFILGFFSCIKETLDIDKLSTEMELNPSIALKIAQGTLDFRNLLDSLSSDLDSLQELNILQDKSLVFVFREDSLLSFEVSDIIEIPETFPESGPESMNFTIGALDIDDFSASKSVSLGEIVQNDGATQAIFTPINETNNIFPPFGPIGGGEYTVEPFSNYTSVTFSSGTIFLTITNNLPVEITTLSVTIKDSNDSIICVLDYLSIPPNGGSQVNNVDLTDRGPFSNQFRAEITGISTVGSAPNAVFISLADELILDIFSENVKIFSGTTILPDQIFGYDSSMVDFDLDGPEKIYKIIFKTAQVNYTVTSNIQEEILVRIILPATKLNGTPLVFEESITYNGGNPTSGTLILDNSITDLTTDPLKPYNVFPFKFEVEIVSSESLVTIYFDDDLSFEFSVNNIDFAYIEGYLGKQEETIDPDSLEIDEEILNKISGTFQFANPTIKFTYRNSFGLPVSLDLNVEGEFNDGSIVDLGASVIDVQCPADTLNPEVEGTIEFNKDNTNVEDLLVFPPPVKIRYSGSATINPLKDTTVINFITNKSKIEGDLEIEIPIEFSAGNLTFQDTMEIELDIEDEDFSVDIEFVKIYVNTRNGFPFDFRFQMIPLDSITSAPCDTLEFTFLSAAPVDDNGVVIEEQDWNQDEIEINQEFLENLEKSDQIIVKVIFNTTGNGANPVKILSDYIFEFNFGIEGKFKFNFDPDED
ncbi:MAG: hypothetical protein GH151_13755 [Bacteroidetes bacterium]|nr:hypothetical protein [Bacteroidota bacterium]